MFFSFASSQPGYEYGTDCVDTETCIVHDLNESTSAILIGNSVVGGANGISMLAGLLVVWELLMYKLIIKSR